MLLILELSLYLDSGGIVNWTKQEVQQLDRRRKKLLTIYNMFHRKGDVDRLYIRRAEGGRGLISVENCVLIEKNSLYENVNNSHK